MQPSYATPRLKLPMCAPEISSLLDVSTATCYAYSDETIQGGQRALTLLDEYIAAEGPFDGVIGFSQGASLAAMHIIRTAQRHAECPFKCAIFFSCSGLYDPAALVDQGEARKLDPVAEGEIIRIPTIHIWGQKDLIKEESEILSKLCDKQVRTVFVHEGGHEVPGLGGKGTVIETVKAMRRGIDRTRSAH